MTAQDYSTTWRDNAERQGVAAQVVVDIAQRHAITAESFEVLETMAEIKDLNGRSFFLIPHETSGHDARAAALLTYVYNAGTGYGRKGKHTNDFPATPWSAAEVTRIIDRQSANGWSYARDVRFVHRNGGRLVTTPHGMLMAAGGNWIQRQFSQRGGTTWGDIFLVNLGELADPVEQLRRIIRSGYFWSVDPHGRPAQTGLDLDRVLHHEERHCRQWAAKGYLGMLRDYSWELIREWVLGRTNRLEVDAGLSDGGYRA